MDDPSTAVLHDFGDIYESHFQRIYAYVYRKTMHRETAEDIVSETFMKALHGMSTFDPSKGSVQSWLYRIATNAVIDFYRKKKIHAADVWDIPSGEDIETDAVNRHCLDAVKRYLGTVPQKKRDIVIMRVWEDMSFREIAESMQENEAQVKMTFYRTIQQLKKMVPLAVLLCAVPRIW
ncbi:MAG: sigma-70 family RNA polymerase sigma factor [Spirochaetes bacterium]|nr:sigma-70 family RNA polymerase sigma factor [Spirochaetota bacterium]